VREDRVAIGLLALLYWLGRRKSFVADKADRVGRREIDPPQLNEAVIVRERQRESVAPIVLPQVNLDDLPEVRIGAAASIPVVDKLSMHEALSTAALERLAITQPIPAESAVQHHDQRGRRGQSRWLVEPIGTVAPANFDGVRAGAIHKARRRRRRLLRAAGEHE